MIDRIIDYSARNPGVVLLITAAATLAGWWGLTTLPLDAIPDLSDTQVIIYSRWDRSPDILEDQVTYPIVSAMLGAPGVKAVRGLTDYGSSFVYVIFEDGTDIYWARARTLEYLSPVREQLPEGVRTELGPDATGLGWIYQYALVDHSGKRSLAELRSVQDWYLRNHLKAVPGVAEVATVGGFGRQYQVNVDPNRLRQYGIPISLVIESLRAGNSEASGRLLEFGGTEYAVRGRGYVRSAADIENIVLKASEGGVPLRIRDVAQVVLGPDIRRGVADLDGTGDTVSGIIVMRQGENALDVIERVKARTRDLEAGLPDGVKLVPVYDRSDLIRRSVATLKTAVIEVMLTVFVIILIFLWHPASAFIPLVTIPLAVLISFLPFRLMGMTANIMSLGGIAIAIGALVDATIVVVEQSHKKLEEWQRTGSRRDYREVIIDAVKEVGAPSFFALLVIAVSFVPVLALEAQEGRLFKPLAYTKTLAIVVAALLAITLDPALRLLFTRIRKTEFSPSWLCSLTNGLLVGRIHPEERHPVSRFLIRIYDPAARWSLRHRWLVVGIAAALLLATIPAYRSLGSEFMPPLDEGSLFYMPSTMPGISIAEAQRLLQATDRIMKQFPEVERVLGKAGRAESATDPAPLSMIETVIVLKPVSEWRRVRTWYSEWSPEWLKPLFRRITPDHISRESLVDEMHKALKIPGVSNSWTMPIRARIDMLSTGIRTPVGIKIQGADLQAVEELGVKVENALRRVRGTRSAFAERSVSGYFLDFEWNREELASFGLTLEDAHVDVQNAVGGENVTYTVEGRARYPVNVRYMRDYRSDVSSLSNITVSAGDGIRQIPIGQLATIRVVNGPAMIRDEDGLLTGYVYIDVAGRDLNGYVEEARETVRKSVPLPAGYSLRWSGQFEANERVNRRLMFVVPATLFVIVLLLYINTRSLVKTSIVLLAVPFSAIGAIWLLWFLGYNMSIGVWVGMIALLGVDAETGIFMLLYLDLAYERARSEGRLRTLEEMRNAILEGAVQRIRPKFMTVATDFIGLLPVLWAVGAGSDVMKRIAAPLVGGVFTSFLLELLVYPAIYEIWKWDFGMKARRDPDAGGNTDLEAASGLRTAS